MRRAALVGVCVWALALALTLGAAASVAAQASLVEGLRAKATQAPADYTAQAALGRALTRAGQYQAAERVLLRARAHAPSPAEGTLRLAEVWIAAGDYERARNTCRSRLLEQKGDAPLLHLCLARAYLAWNRSSKAFAELDEVYAEAPDLKEAQLVYGEALRLRSRVDQARAAYAKAETDPRWRAEAALGLARLELGLGDTQAAIAALRRALESEPQLPEAQLELGSLIADTPEGLALLDAALKNRPGWAQAAVALGDAQLSHGNAPEAEQAYRVALAQDARDFAAHRGLGRALLARGDVDGAQASLQRALDLYANDAQTTLAMGEVLLARGDVDAALEELRHAADLDPADPTGLLRAAEVCLQEHRYTLARGYLDRLLGKHPQSALGLALYGDVLRARGRRSEAREYYQRALAAKGPVDQARVQAALSELQ